MYYFACSPNNIITMIGEGAAVRNADEVGKSISPGYIFFAAELAPLED